jgi:diguanylate cyclase (GGDEF)-like protein
MGKFASLSRRVAYLRTSSVHRQIVAMATVMCAVAALLIGITFYSGRTMDREAIAQQQALIDNAFTTRLARAVGELRSVAWWDDMVVYTSPQNYDVEWLDREIGSYMVESYQHDRIMVIDENNRPIYAYGEGSGLGTPVLARDLAALKKIVRQARGGPDVSPRIHSTAKPGELYELGKTENRKYSRGFGAVTVIDGRPVVATALLITPSYDVSRVSPTRRIVMSVIEVTPDVLSDIGASTMMPDLSFAKAGDKRLGHFSLHTDDGTPLATLGWTPKQPGTEMVERVLPWIAAALGTALVFLGGLVIRLLRSTSKIAQREEEAQHLANHDGLTGLPNRRKLAADFAGTAALGPLTIVCIDLDRFKDINDTLGHQAGDALIRAVAGRIAAGLLPGDVLARLGGDELALLRPGAEERQNDIIASSIMAAFDRPFPVLGHEIEVHASVGIANGAKGCRFDDLIRQADIALFEAKGRGRGRAVRFAAEMGERLEKRHAIEIDLKRAIAERELNMHYQPIVHALTGTIASVEALVRWESPVHGAVRPDIFVGIAEESGMMADLGRFVLDRAIEDAQRWPQIETAINISPAQLRSATLVNDLVNATARHGISPGRITLEITETVLLANDERTRRVLHTLKELGFALALDDFGTGYSSLSYLRDFPFDKLKIDRSFVSGVSKDDKSLSIIEGVVNFGKILGREIVAEGVETEQEMQAMQQAGCTHLQGYLFSRALAADHVEAMAATFGRLGAKRASTLAPAATEPAVAQRSTLVTPAKAGVSGGG